MQMSGYAEECVCRYSVVGAMVVYSIRDRRLLRPVDIVLILHTSFAVGQAKRRDNFASSGSVLLRYVVSIKPRWSALSHGAYVTGDDVACCRLPVSSH